MISKTLITDLRSTSKPAEKIKILKDNDCDFLRYLLKSTYEPFETYQVKIKDKEINKVGDLTIAEPLVVEAFRNVIEFCRNSQSNKQNRERVLPVLEILTKDTQELLLGVLHKNWKVGISNKLIAKAFPGLVKQFNVQLANNYLSHIKKKKYKPKQWYCSYKLDGVRCIFLRLIDDFNYADGTWVAFSRQGKEFLTVDHLKPQLELLWEMHGTDFWDGELYIPGAPFEYIQSEVTSFTKGTSFELEYRTFVCGDQKAFLDCNDQYPFKIVEDYHVDLKAVDKIIPAKQWIVEADEIDAELEKAFDLGYEGIMLRDPSKLYDFKRSDALLKLKESTSENSQEKIVDCLVVDVIVDKFPVINNETLVYKELLVKIIVEQEDKLLCKVGSGFDLEFRYKYTESPEDLIGKVVEIKFQGYGSKGLMRFPRLHRIREDIDWEN
jgi:DNA ligase-1